MAWASVGEAGTVAGSGNNQASLAVTLNSQAGSAANVGDFLVYSIAVDNNSSVSNADEGAVSGVSDSDGVNTWSKAAEITAGGGASQGGATCSVWYSDIVSSLTTTATVTATFTNATARDASAAIVWRFSKTGSPSVEATTFITVATSASGSLDLTASDATERLRFRAIAAESTLTTSLTTSSGWSSIGTTRASATKAMSIRGEYRIISASTAASSPSMSAASDNASIYVLFREDIIQMLGDGTF